MTHECFGPRAVWFGVYDALSARLVEALASEPGFPNPSGLWLSSYCVSAALRACPDASILTSAEMIDVARACTGACPTIPIIVDCDSGYGDARVFAHVVRDITRTCPVGSVCLEDKVFPKRNSFYPTNDQALEPLEVAQSKIEAAADVIAANDSPLTVIARTEALVLGAGVPEALRRMSAFVEAGADAVMVQATGDLSEMIELAARWKGQSHAPLVTAPTVFADVSPERFWSFGFDVFIYANHLLRASLEAQRAFLSCIAQPSATAARFGPSMCTIDHLNRLVGAASARPRPQRRSGVAQRRVAESVPA